MISATLREVLQQPGIRQGFRNHSIDNERTGFAQLDRCLPGCGWPRRGLVELLTERLGLGELALLMPVLRHRTQCWVAPPQLPYAPALMQAGVSLDQLLLIQPDHPKDALWAMEQVLRSGTQSNVLGWLESCRATDLRRLQLAAETGNSRLFLFRSARALAQASPAVLRLSLDVAQHSLQLRIIKCRGGYPQTLELPLLGLLRSAHVVAGAEISTTADQRAQHCVA